MTYRDAATKAHQAQISAEAAASEADKGGPQELLATAVSQLAEAVEELARSLQLDS